jgi:beta-mannanase
MKRSEMLKQLYEMDFEWWSMEDVNDFKLLLKQVLDTIEKQGMLPPDYLITYGERNDHYVNEWEPEND